MSNRRFEDVLMKVKDTPTRLKLARINAGLKQQDAALALGLTHQSISKIEAGQSTISIETVAILAALYNTTPNYLILGEE